MDEYINVNTFMNLPEKDYNESTFKIGDLFLMGENMIEQKENKLIGDQVSVYEVTDIENDTVKYIVKYFILQKEI